MPRSSLLAALVTLVVTVGAAPAASGDSQRRAEPRVTPVAYRVTASAKLEGSTLIVRATLRDKGTSRALPGATVRVADRTKVTNRAGVARFTLPSPPKKAFTVTVRKAKLQGLKLTVHPRVATE